MGAWLDVRWSYGDDRFNAYCAWQHCARWLVLHTNFVLGFMLTNRPLGTFIVLLQKAELNDGGGGRDVPTQMTAFRL
jgi:hypothetical protein